tara:strand:- start:759 stop:887 length:129 start_codon:yes stop_codon:yes gene_type:complete
VRGGGGVVVGGGSGGDVVVAVHGPGDLNGVDWKLCATLIHNT